LVRLTKDRKMNDADANRRMKVQNPQSDKLARASVVIKNDGSVDETWKQVQTAWEDVKAEVMKRFGGTATGTNPVVVASPAPAASAKPATPAGATQKAPAAAPAVAPAALGTVEVKRGMPSNAQAIAEFVTRHGGKPVSRMDIMMSFGQKSYLIAEAGTTVVAVLGWQVENLITRADEFYIEQNPDKGRIVKLLLESVESASEELQSEVCFVFLPVTTPADTVKAFMSSEYEVTGIRDIKVPAWREAVQDTLSVAENMQILYKKLREDRILKPI
jgi:dephospho-CoA kinase